MTHGGPFQPLPFCVICVICVTLTTTLKAPGRGRKQKGKGVLELFW